MLRKLFVTLSLSILLVVIPALEVGDTHVFNPLWPSHARLHEVWQLLTNAGLALIALWLAWRSTQIRLASVIGLTATLGFIGAYFLRHSYGGSMIHTDGTELSLWGINLGVLVMTLASMGLLFGLSGQQAARP